MINTGRIAALEAAVESLTAQVRELRQVAERVSDVPAPDSPAQRRERAAHVAAMAAAEAQARDRADAQSR